MRNHKKISKEAPNKNKPITVSDRIRKCRETLGMSKAQLAKKSGFPRATITHIEQRCSDNLSAKTLKKLADVLDVSADYLLGRSRNKYNQQPTETKEEYK